MWLLFASLALWAPTTLGAATAVLTYHNDQARTGANTSETILTPANVNSNSFGLLSSRAVDDSVFAQPLVMTNVTVPGKGTYNLVIVATVNDSIYAFDADDASVSVPYWQVSFLGPNVVPTKSSDMSSATGRACNDYFGNCGIVGTPVIDPATRTLYVVVRTKEYGTNFVQRLHALDVTTGMDRSNSPVVIQATYPGSGPGSVGGVLTFDPKIHNQRAGLALVNGVVYIEWAAHCDFYNYHGWLIGYDARTLTRSAVFVTTPNGEKGGIWASGAAPAVDGAGNLYLEDGNGTFDPANQNFGDSFLKLSTTNGLTLVDYFTPFNQADLLAADLDLGSGGTVVLPDSVGSASHPHLVIGGSKAGTIYLLDRDNLGHFQAGSDSQIVRSITNATGMCYDTPAYFNNRLYLAGSADYLKAFALGGGTINPTPVSRTSQTFQFPAPTPSVSANGTNGGIVWVIESVGWTLGSPPGGVIPPAVLRAYNAANLGQELYNSSQAGSRDKPVGGVKCSVPTVANGKVFVGGQFALSTFGNASFVADPIISPNGASYTNSITVTLSDATPGVSIYYTLDNSVPTTNSLLYSGPLVLTNTVTLRAKAFKSAFQSSATVLAGFLNTSAAGNGTGLLGAYFSNQAGSFNGTPTLTRLDPTVNFIWGYGSPDPLISTDRFSVRWTGAIQPQYSETYTIYFKSDDGVRLWVNGTQLLNNWVQQSPTETSGSIDLSTQQKYNIKIEYFEEAIGAQAVLYWSSPSTPKQIIPTSQLYSLVNLPPVITLSSPVNGATGAAPSLTITALASDPDGSVTKVDFFVNTNFLGTVSNSVK